MAGFGMTDVAPETAKKNSPKNLFKIILQGDSESGKTTALMKFTQDRFTPDYISTIGIDFAIKTVEMGGKIATLQIWDTAGQERFRSISNSYYRGAQGIFMFFDLTKRESLDHIQNCHDDIKRYAEEDVVLIMVGTKADLTDDREVDEKDIEVMAKELGIDFFKISSKTGECIHSMFERMVEKLMQVKKDKSANASSGSSMLKPTTVNQRGGQNKSKSCVIL